MPHDDPGGLHGALDDAPGRAATTTPESATPAAGSSGEAGGATDDEVMTITPASGSDVTRDSSNGASTARTRRRAFGWSALVGAVLGIACVVFVTRTLVSQWSKVHERIVHASPWWLLLAVVLAALAMAWVAYVWRHAMATVGATARRGKVVAWYFLGEMGKYLPGGVWPVLGRGELARRGGITATRAYPSVGLSLAGLYLAGIAVAVALVPFDLAHQSESPAALSLLLLLPIGLALLHPRVLRWIRSRVARITKREIDVPIPSWRSTIGLVVRYVPGWLLIGAATWALARAIMPNPPVLRIFLAAVLSWVAGFVAVPVPAGAGVREAVFVAASGLPSGIGATIAVASRLVFLVVDVGGAVVTSPLHRHRRDRGTPSPLASAE